MRRSVMAVVTCAALLLAAPAFGASKKDRDDCNLHVNPDTQIASCTRVINDRSESLSNRALAYDSRAVAWVRKLDFDHAIADYGEAIRLDPKDASHYAHRAGVWVLKSDFDHAIADYNEALKLNPKDHTVLVSRGDAWRQKGDFDRAIADYNEALTLRPDFADGYSSRGAAYISKQDYERAIADYDWLIKAQPTYAVFYQSRGGAWFAKGDPERAIADYSEAIRLSPSPGAYLLRCNARVMANRDLALALADCNEGLRTGPNDPNSNAAAMNIRGFVYLRLGRLDDAIADFDAALKIYPTLPTLLHGRGIAKLQKGDRAGGDADIAAARAAWPDVEKMGAKYGFVPPASAATATPPAK